MSKKKIHDTAINLLNGKISHIRNMIDRGYNYESIYTELRELQVQADFSETLSIISEDELLAFKEQWYGLKELLDTLFEDAS